MSALSGIDIALWDLKGMPSEDRFILHRVIHKLITFEHATWTSRSMSYWADRSVTNAKCIAGSVVIDLVTSKLQRR
jgi:hypothetical protein